MPARDNKAAIKILLQTLKLNPELWETRKKTAEILFDEEQYVEAADMLWSAPEIPSTDIDVAFAIKIISRARPNRAIRMIYEIVRRNNGKPAKNMAVARALNDIGMYMQAARFYGAALASDPLLFDLGFERQVLWLDDSHRLIEEWQESDQEYKPPLDVPRQDIPGGTIAPSEIPEDIAGLDQAGNFQVPLVPSALATPPPNPAINPLLQKRRTLIPATMQPASTEVEPMTTPAPIRHPASVPPPAHAPVTAQAVPTQPLPAAAVKVASAATGEEPVSPGATVGSTTGKLLTPSLSKSPQMKLK